VQINEVPCEDRKSRRAEREREKAETRRSKSLGRLLETKCEVKVAGSLLASTDWRMIAATDKTAVNFSPKSILLFSFGAQDLQSLSVSRFYAFSL